MSTLRTYCQLLRLPAVFTAMADIFLGYLLTHAELTPLRDFSLLLLASSCLYLAGMVFNDIFDRDIDSQERPHRPIPSRRVRVSTAAGLGMVLMFFGLAASAVVSAQSFAVAGSLSLLILAYDRFFKRTVLGPLAMGGCRLLNVMLGASTAAAVWGPPQTHFAFALGLYVVGITWFARDEAKISRRKQLIAAASVANLGIVLMIALVAIHFGSATDNDTAGSSIPLVVFLFAIILLTIDRRLAMAIGDPVPEKVQSAIKVMLMSLVTLDAAIVLFASGNAVFALMTLSLFIPARILSRWMAIT